MTDLFSTRSTSDAELITAVRDGDDAAFAELYRRHLESAKAAARSLTRSRSDADDVVAEGFTRVLQAIRNGGGPQLAFRPYLVTAARNAYFDRMRKDKRIDSRQEVPEVLDLAVLRQSDSADDRDLAARAFASLPERWQLVLWHTEVEGRTPAEVGPLLGLAPNAAAALAYRAREGLRQAYLQAHLQQPIPPECAEIRPQLGAYVRDGLSMRDRRKIDAHLETCKQCEGLVADLYDANRGLRGALIPLLLGVPAARYIAHLGGGSAVAGFARRQPKSVQGVAAAAAAVVLVGVSTFSVNRLGKPVPRAAAAASVSSVVSAVNSARAKGSTGASGQRTGFGASVTADVSDPSLPVPGDDSTSPPDPTIAAGLAPDPSGVLLPVFPTIVPTTRARFPVTTTRPRTATTARPTTTTTTTSPTTSPAVTSTTADTPTPAPTLAPTAAPTTAALTPTPAPTVAPTPPTLFLTMSASLNAIAGQSVYLNIAVGNGIQPAALHLPQLAEPALPTVTFDLPDQMRLGAGADRTDWQCAQAGRTVTCVLAGLNAGQESKAQVELSIDPAALGTLTISPATVQFDGASATASSRTLIFVSPGSVALPPTSPEPKTAPTLLYYASLQGGLAVAGNSSVSCDDKGDAVLGRGTAVLPSCADARAGKGGVRNNRQSNKLIANKVLEAGEQNSSSATLTIPQGASVVRAFLAWSGDSSTPSPPKLITPATAHNTYASAVDVTLLNVNPSPNPHLTVGSGIYESFADVSAAVREGGPGSYTVADIPTDPSLPDSLGGWSLFVVYADQTAPVQTVAIVDQYSTLAGKDTTSTVAVGGISPTPPDAPAPAHNVSLAYFANEGDFGRLDSLARSAPSVRLGDIALGGDLDASNPDIFNVFNSSIVSGATIAGGPSLRNPGYLNNFGIDIDRFDVAGVPVGSDGIVTATFSSDTDTDKVSVGLVAFVIS